MDIVGKYVHVCEMKVVSTTHFVISFTSYPLSTVVFPAPTAADSNSRSRLVRKDSSSNPARSSCRKMFNSCEHSTTVNIFSFGRLRYSFIVTGKARLSY